MPRPEERDELQVRDQEAEAGVGEMLRLCVCGWRQQVRRGGPHGQAA